MYLYTYTSVHDTLYIMHVLIHINAPISDAISQQGTRKRMEEEDCLKWSLKIGVTIGDV